MKVQKMKKYSLFILLWIGFACFSQNYKGNISIIEKEGLYKIMLTSEIRAASKNNFNFIRIIDTTNQEVPYVLKSASDRYFSTFSPVKILSKKRIKDSVTIVLIANGTVKKYTSLILQIANTKISKRYDISGSNNGKEWFGISSNNLLRLRNASNKSLLEKSIDFPKTAYNFLKIEFNDKHSQPINILGVGLYKNKFFSEKPVVVAQFNQQIIQLKDRKVTQFKFKARSSHEINGISFDIKTAFFLRNAKLLVSKTRKIKKRLEIYEEVIYNFQLSSKKDNIFVLNNFNEKEFIIEIDNQDNPLLDIAALQLLQKPVYIISNLRQHQKYQFIIDTTFSKPFYDLGSFISEHVLNIDDVSVTHFLKVKNKGIIIKSKSFWQNPVFMWLCIIFVSMLLFYFALDLLKDMKP
jgi:hypothetical protein